MSAMKQASGATALALILAASGCESVALMPRPDVDQSDASRNGSSVAREGIEPGRTANEMAGSVQRVDAQRQEIYLRTSDGVTVVRYDSQTVVYSHTRELPVEDLRPGDQIVVKFGNGPRYERYADIIRLENERRDREY